MGASGFGVDVSLGASECFGRVFLEASEFGGEWVLGWCESGRVNLGANEFGQKWIWGEWVFGWCEHEGE